MNPQRNPSEERLLAYAAGTLSPPEAVVMAAHLAMRVGRRTLSGGVAHVRVTPCSILPISAMSLLLSSQPSSLSRCSS